MYGRLNHGEIVYRLTCNHLFHEQCWDNYMQHEALELTGETECPNCRGPGVCKARYRYVGAPRGQARHHHRHAAATPSRESSYHDVESPQETEDMFMASAVEIKKYVDSWSPLELDAWLATQGLPPHVPWDPAAAPPAEVDRGNAIPHAMPDELRGNAHRPGDDRDAPTRADIETSWAQFKTQSRTKLPGGKLSMLVDLGSRINIIGCNTERDFSLEAEKHGLKTTYERRKHQLNVNGVGAGSAPCNEVASIPIAVAYEETPGRLDEYRTNIATGSGADLPAILGSASMQEKDSVIVLRKGKEFLAFPGPGGYKIEWSPGTRLLPMTTAPSGHLVVPCYHFESVVDINTPSADTTVFVTDYSR